MIIQVIFIVLVVIVAIPLFFYLRKMTIKRYAGYLKEAKSVINGEWIKFGLILEGEYKGRKVRCGFFEGGDGPVSAFLRMKPNKLPSSLAKSKYEWVDWHWKMFKEKPPLSIFANSFFEGGYFVEQLEKLLPFCKEVEETGEIIMASKDIDSGFLRFSYKSKLLKHSGPPETRRISFKKNLGIPIGTKIFIFSCYDDESVGIASKINFDYGFCIECNSLNDIEDFKKRAGIKQPAYIANDQIVESFNVTSYPALITVKEDGFQIQEGF